MSDDPIALDAIARSVRAHRAIATATKNRGQKKTPRPHPASIEQLLTDPGSDLKFLFDKIKAHKSVFSEICELLPEWARDDLVNARLDGGHLILCFRNGATANRFNYERIDFLNNLRRRPQFAGLCTVTCKVTPSG